MLDFPRWKIWAIGLTLLAGVLLAVPNFFSEAQVRAWPSWAPHSQLNLGLDLRGGSYLLLEADTADVARTRLESLDDSVRSDLRGANIATSDIAVAGGRLSFLLANPGDLDRAMERMRDLTRPVGTTGQRDYDVTAVDGNRIQLTPTDSGIASAIETGMATEVEVIRRRIDALGTREPDIRRQGDSRILVQVPGLQDPTALKALIGKTAKLEFKLVDTDADPAAVAQGHAPPGSQVLGTADPKLPPLMAVKRRAIITGEQLTKAELANDPDGRPAVAFGFNSDGSRRFAKATTDNVHKPFAIILDNKILSAPNINEPILGGSGIISGNFTTDTANQLAIVLKSGALPLQLKVVEERTVGPDLGADSIRAGTLASIVAIVAVGLLIIATYGRFGLYAVAALVLNILLILGIMSLVGATLTLPGIAGLVLTIGAAVDANVLINERIREELRRGRTKIVQAVEVGYREATRTIWDANSLNIIVAIIMFWFGSGPVKGFAVVLTIGIVTSVFTAVTVTRLMVAQYLRRSRPLALAI